MTLEQILAFPTYDELLKQVAPHKQADAKEFGDRIAENRDRAKDAAKKSRDEKRQKIEQLEGQVDGLEEQVAKMRAYISALLGSGRVSQVEVAAFL
jgi:polyhydroxyalkanoate synthesis regulator phasin